MKKIIIAGAGFAGLSAALRLEKTFKKENGAGIILVDRHDYHLFTPNLYEVATADEEFTSIAQLKKSVAIPVGEVISGKDIKFIKGEIRQINQMKRKISVGSREMDYDYLVVALGNVADFYGIEGVEKHALPLQSLPDALRVRNAVEFAAQRMRMEPNRRFMRVVVAGGGCSSVEMAGELKGFLDEVAWKNGLDRENMEIVLAEAGSNLLAGIGEQAAREAYFRLKQLGIRVELSHRISRVDNNFVEFLGGEKVEYDVLVWAAGAKAFPVPFAHAELKDKKGRLLVNDFLQLEDFPNIFVIGDLSAAAAGKPPFLGGVEQALDQARYLAEALPQLMRNRRPQPFKPASRSWIVNIGGKWAIVKTDRLNFTGIFAYIIGRLVRFRYYRRICGFRRAVKYWLLQQELYGRND